MKKLFENFRNFTEQEEDTKKYQIFCDMDGVLVDFVKGAVHQIASDVEDATLASQKPSGAMTKLGKLRQILEKTGQEVEMSHIENNKKKVNKAFRDYMYERLYDDREFWANLPWIDGGREIWNAIADKDPFILTAPMGPESELGKQDWINKNLTPAPTRVFMSHDKWKWSESNHVLIDDFMKNIGPWRKKGGIGIHHSDKNIDETLSELNKYIKF